MTPTSTPTPTRHLGWRIAGITATVVVIGAAIVVGPALVWGSLQELDTTTKQSADTFHRVPTSISVDATTASIVVTATDSEEVAVERSVEWARKEPSINESWSDDALHVELECPNGIIDWFTDVCRIDYAANVPEHTPVDVHQTTGDITVEGAVSDSDLTTTTGSIKATASTAGNTSAETTTGSIDLDYATAPDDVTASVTTGDITITVPDDGAAYRVLGETHTGERDIQVVTDPAAERVIDLNSTTGDVEVAYR